MHVYDKAKWHHEAAEFPRDLPASQAFVHIGFVLAWLIKRELASDLFRDDFEDDIERMAAGQLTGRGLLEIADGALADGALVEEMVTPRAHRFLQDYYSSEGGAFWEDYKACFEAAGMESIYHVQDTRENGDALSSVLDERFASWERPPDAHGRTKAAVGGGT